MEEGEGWRDADSAVTVRLVTEGLGSGGGESVVVRQVEGKGGTWSAALLTLLP